MTEQPVTIPEEVHPILSGEMFATLTTVRPDGSLSTNPVSFTFDHERVRISTLKSRKKYRNLRGDDRVALCVMSSANPMSYVEIRGRATLEDDPDRTYLREQWMAHSGGMEPPADLDPPHEERVTIVITPTAVSSPTLYEGRLDSYFED